MPEDKRSRKIALVAHCILNQNSRAATLAERSNAIKEVIAFLIEKNVGIIQMPCPEMDYAGAARKPRTKKQYDTPKFRNHCRKIAKMLADQAKKYSRSGVKLKIIIGVGGSPSCDTTEESKGIFIEELQSALAKRAVSAPFCAVSYSTVQDDIQRLERVVR